VTHVGEEFALRLVGDFRALLCGGELRSPRVHLTFELSTVSEEAALVMLHLRNHAIEVVDERADLVASLRILARRE
jgi:hypothetical protein